MNNNVYDKAIDDITCVYGYVVNKDTYGLEHINSHLKRELAIAQDEDFFVGKKCYRVIYKAKRPCEFCNMHVMKLGETRKWYRCVKQTRKHLAVRDSLQEIDDKICFIQSIQNVTEDVNQMLNLQNIASLDKAVKACTRILTEENDLKKSNQKLLKIVSEFYTADSAYIYEFNQEENTFMLLNTHYLDKTSHKVSKVIEFDDKLKEELFSNDYITLNEEEHGNTEYYKALVGSTEKDLLLSPIKTNDVISGLIGLNNFDDTVTNFELVSMVSSFVSNNLNIDNTQTQLNSTLNDMEETMGSNKVMIDCVKALLDGSDNDSEGSIKQLLSIIQDYYDCDRTYFFECDMVNRYIKNINEHLKTGVKSSIPTLKDIEFDTLLKWLDYIDENGHINISDCKNSVDSTTFEFTLIMKNNVNSIIMTPLYKENVLCGILAVENINSNMGDASLLKSVSTFVVSHINKVAVVKNLEELSFNDELTGLYNRNFYISYVDQLKNQTHKKIGIIFADVNGLKKANDNFGHEFGDILIKWCANFLRKNTGSLMFRVGGDEFICLFENVTNMEFDFCIRRLELEMDKIGRKLISFGGTWRETNTDIDGQIAETDKVMYKAKQQYYDDRDNSSIDDDEDLAMFKEILTKLKKEI